MPRVTSVADQLSVETLGPTPRVRQISGPEIAQQGFSWLRFLSPLSLPRGQRHHHSCSVANARHTLRHAQELQLAVRLVPGGSRRTGFRAIEAIDENEIGLPPPDQKIDLLAAPVLVRILARVSRVDGG
jgi:hypothetical protein